MKASSMKNNISSLQLFKRKNQVKLRNSHKELYEILDGVKNPDNNLLLSIILPVFNEENTILQVIQELPKHKWIEIILVDDHSTDNSLNLIRATDYNGEMHIIEHKFNQGYGAALMTGLHHSQGEIIVTMDSDGQHRPYDIYNLVKPILNGEADITIGSRYMGSYNYKLPLLTRFGEALLEVIIRFFFAQKVKNNQGGFRAFHRRTYDIFEKTRFHGYAFTTELILSAVLEEHRIKEVPIDLKSREHGTSYIVLYKLLISLGLCIWLYILKNTKRLFSKGKKLRSKKFN